jgi:hypothetical protein
MSLLAGLIGGGGKGGAQATSAATGTQNIGGDTFVMPVATPVSSAGGLNTNTLLMIGGALVAVVLIVLLLRK